MARIKLTVPRINLFECPSNRTQAFLWDSEVPGLAIRATAGKKGYIYQSRLNGASLRLNIGDVNVWAIEEFRDINGIVARPGARQEARRLQASIDQGRDPREVKAEVTAADESKRATTKRQAVTFSEAWQAYLTERRPHWGELHYLDHLRLSQAGGEPRRRLKTIVKTTAGPLAQFMSMKLSDITPEIILAWGKRESPKRPARVRLAVRLLKAFLRWCSDDKAYKGLVNPDAASTKKVRETVGTAKTKNDNIQREQLFTWFEHVHKIPNQTISVFLQCLLLTGVRREELATLKWEHINFQWRGLSIKDKMEGTREVPLTPYVAHLLAGLPKRNDWVFSSTTSKSGRLAEPSIAHRRACAAAGLDGLTLHGLRRSYASLCEWLDIPGGISAQIQGHAPQGVREQNYVRRPLDLLRVHADKIETWILEQAKIEFDASVKPGALRVVGSNANK
jgi:site-specific recombinase XerC